MPVVLESMVKVIRISDVAYKKVVSLKHTKPEYRSVISIIDIAVDRLKREEEASGVGKPASSENELHGNSR